jgi:hypothetical protein
MIFRNHSHREHRQRPLRKFLNIPTLEGKRQIHVDERFQKCQHLKSNIDELNVRVTLQHPCQNDIESNFDEYGIKILR